MMTQTYAFRPQWAVFVFGFCSVLLICQACKGQAFDTEAASRGTFSPERFTQQRFDQYEQQLNAVLKTRREEERLFVSQVVARVRTGQIPSRMVQTSFQWVYKKRPRTNFPFIYFERVLRLQADRADLAVQIPPFDFDIYRDIDTGVRSFIRGGSKTTQGPGLGSDQSVFGQ